MHVDAFCIGVQYFAYVLMVSNHANCEVIALRSQNDKTVDGFLPSIQKSVTGNFALPMFKVHHLSINTVNWLTSLMHHVACKHRRCSQMRQSYTSRRSWTVTGQLADTPTRGLPTRGLDNSCSGQVANWTTRGCHRRLFMLTFRSFGGMRDRELSSPRLVQSASWQSASCPVTSWTRALQTWQEAAVVWRSWQSPNAKFSILRKILMHHVGEMKMIIDIDVYIDNSKNFKCWGFSELSRKFREFDVYLCRPQ